MARPRLDIMDIKQLIQLKSKGYSNRKVAEALHINRNTVNQYVRFFNQKGQDYETLLCKSEGALKAFFPATFSELCCQLSMHYGIELEAARVGKPRDKGHVERHVGIVYNRLYAPLRNETFYSLEQINKAFTAELIKHNNKNFQGKDYSRKDLFEQEEKPVLSALPTELFEIKKCVRAKVQRNYHVILGEDKHQYSVPYKYIGKTTEVIYTSQHVEVYLGVSRIAAHKRDRRKYGYSTFRLHMPEKHKKYLEQRGWDAAYFIRQAEKIGDNTAWAIKEILKSKAIIEQTYNAYLGVLRMAKTYSPQRLEKACARARTTHTISYTILNNILKKNLDSIEVKTKPDLFTIPDHQNIRGANNYY